MRVKKYKAKEIGKALEMVKQDLGEEALILSTEQISPEGEAVGSDLCYEITAGITEDTNDTANVRSPSGVQPGGDNVKRRDGESKIDLLIPSLKKESEGKPVYRDIKGDSLTGKGVVLSPMEVKLAELREEIEELKGLFNAYSISSQYKCDLLLDEVMLVLFQRLLVNGVDRSLAFQLIRELKTIKIDDGPDRKSRIYNLLRRMIAGKVRTRDPLNMMRKGIIVFVGPTGVGKTTTLVKLAAYAKIRLKKKITVLAMDDSRIGTVDQLRTCAEILEVEFDAARSKADLLKRIESIKRSEILFVDTSGISHRDLEALGELREILRFFREAKIMLLLSANTDGREMKAMLSNFSCLGPEYVSITKLDEAESFGSFLSPLYKSDMHLAYLTTGRQIPEDIELASAERMADIIMNPASLFGKGA